MYSKLAEMARADSAVLITSMFSLKGASAATATEKEGTQRMGTLKGASSVTGDDDGMDRSEVIRRHLLSAGAGTPLYT